MKSAFFVLQREFDLTNRKEYIRYALRRESDGKYFKEIGPSPEWTGDINDAQLSSSGWNTIPDKITLKSNLLNRK